MLSGVRWILAYLLASLAAAIVIAFYVLRAAGAEGGLIPVAWVIWLAVSILAAPLTIIGLGLPEIFDIRPRLIVWTVLGALIGLLSQPFWLATPFGMSVADVIEALPRYDGVPQPTFYGLMAAAGAAGGFVLALLRRGPLR